MPANSRVAGDANAARLLTRREKIQQIFDRFDANGDGALDGDEMAAFVAAVNPSVQFTADQISSVLDEIFRSYADFVPDPAGGLSLSGLVQTYDDGAGDVDRDFAALFLSQNPNPNPNPNPIPRIAPGITYESTWKAVEDLELIIRARIRACRSNRSVKNSTLFDGFSENGWSAELSLELDRKTVFSRENSAEYRAFLKELKEIRVRIDQSPTREEAFDGHIAIGRTLHDRGLFAEALESFRRAIELKPSDVWLHYQIGNTLMALQRPSEAKGSYLTALESAESDSEQCSEILPQIHVNLGIVMEREGLLINASEHYREAAILWPTHYRALKLLGSALFGVGEYGSAEKALEEAILLNPEFSDAHCDLGSVLHAVGEEERAVLAFQKAIDLKPDHLDAIYNLGGLFKDVGRFQRAAEVYGRVLAVRPNHWRAQLNRALSLLGAGETEEAKKALNEAFKLTNRVELDDAVRHLNQLHKNPRGGDVDWVVVDSSKFKQANEKTTDRQQLVDALWIRELQKSTKLGRCDVSLLKKELEIIEVSVSNAGNRVISGRSIRKAELEVILRKLLHFLRPETFQGAVKAIGEKIWAVLDVTGSGKVDLGMFFAIVAPMCEGSPEKRKRAAFDALLWRPKKDENHGKIAGVDVAVYLKYLRVICCPSQSFTDFMEMNGGEEDDDIGISFLEFLHRFDDAECGFGVMSSLIKLEAGIRVRSSRHSCAVCRYRIAGLLFKETTSQFCLCASCYSECKLPIAFPKEEYKFKECHIE